MEITLNRATSNDKDVVRRLFQLFAYDISELSGKDIGDDGLYHGLTDIDDYISKANYASYFIRVDGKLAGIAVVRFDEGINYLRHFFIIRKYRNKKVGIKSAFSTFDMFKGRWRVSTMDFNLPAIKFWKKVCDLYSSGQYIEMRRIDNKGPQYEF